VPLAVFRGYTCWLQVTLVVFGVGLAMALDEWVCLIATDGSNASYLLPVSFWGAVFAVGAAVAYTVGLTAYRARRRESSLNRTFATLFVLVVTFTLSGCGDDEPTVPDDAPPGHTISQDGVPHMPGLMDPTQNCVACHGADLMGGDGGEPSCFSCHGKKWP
jgi:hypothetical protein